MDVGSIDPCELWRIIAKNCTNFLYNFFVTYLGCVITKRNKSQKTSTCYVKYVLFILEKQSKKSQFTPVGILGLIVFSECIL